MSRSMPDASARDTAFAATGAGAAVILQILQALPWQTLLPILQALLTKWLSGLALPQPAPVGGSPIPPPGLPPSIPNWGK